MIRAVFLSGLTVAALAGAALGADLELKTGERVTDPRAIIVRGMNVTFCDAPNEMVKALHNRP